MKLRNDCDQIVRRALAAVQPDAAVRRALEGNPFQGGRVVLVAVGKAAWSMARAACDCVGGPSHLPTITFCWLPPERDVIGSFSLPTLISILLLFFSKRSFSSLLLMTHFL